MKRGGLERIKTRLEMIFTISSQSLKTLQLEEKVANDARNNHNPISYRQRKTIFRRSSMKAEFFHEQWKWVRKVSLFLRFDCQQKKEKKTISSVFYTLKASESLIIVFLYYFPKLFFTLVVKLNSRLFRFCFFFACILFLFHPKMNEHF